MKTSDTINGKCPVCGGPVSKDLADKGYVRHTVESCGHGLRGRDGKGDFRPLPPKSKSQKGLQEHEKTVTIPAREHNELSYAATLLQALKDFGVEDWDGWESAIESAEENHDEEMPT
jgi:hypothetical protein